LVDANIQSQFSYKKPQVEFPSNITEFVSQVSSYAFVDFGLTLLSVKTEC